MRSSGPAHVTPCFINETVAKKHPVYPTIVGCGEGKERNAMNCTRVMCPVRPIVKLDLMRDGMLYIFKYLARGTNGCG